MNLAGFTPAQLEQLSASLACKALVYRVRGRLYSATRCGTLGWWVREMVAGSSPAFVNNACDQCDCGELRCDHLVAMQGGGNNANM